MQTIAELCYHMKLLTASFFSSRSVSHRNRKTFLVTTFVDQLIVSIPEIRPAMNSRPKETVLDGLDECDDPESKRYM